VITPPFAAGCVLDVVVVAVVPLPFEPLPFGLPPELVFPVVLGFAAGRAFAAGLVFAAELVFADGLGLTAGLAVTPEAVGPTADTLLLGAGVAGVAVLTGVSLPDTLLPPGEDV